ncbi:class B sortase [Enterococcus sp. DIV0421]|uniref:class B sortase n=1 Tax=Enterococcus sp. DIV0421 TaxID=2774688 RepID=UPI003F682756
MTEIILIVVFLFSAYKIIHIKMTEHKENNQFEELRQKIETAKRENKKKQEKNDDLNKDTKTKSLYTKDIDDNTGYEILAEENKDYIGWLTIPDTSIDYPVMSTPDNPNYYLRRNFKKEYSLNGTPYIGEGIGPDKKCFIIYGHHMKNGSMFGTLEKYEEVGYKDSHPFIYFNIIGESRKYEVIGAFRVDLENPHFDYYDYYGDLSEESFDDYISKLSEITLYGEVKDIRYGEQVLMLSTCSYFVEEGRFIVVAKRVR